jgi:hypothetical protein
MGLRPFIKKNMQKKFTLASFSPLLAKQLSLRLELAQKPEFAVYSWRVTSGNCNSRVKMQTKTKNQTCQYGFSMK